MPSMSTSRIVELGQQIAKCTKILDRYYSEHGLPRPSFEEDGPEDTVIRDDLAVEKARLTLVEASLELHDLVQGPAMQIRPMLNGTSLQMIYKYDLPAKVPSEGEISYEQLARLSGLQTDIVRRVVRYAIVHHRIFHEKHEGYVSHSAASKLLFRSQDAMASVGFLYEDCYPAFSHNAEVIEEIGYPVANRSGWTVAHQTDSTVYDYFREHPERGVRIGQCMRQNSKGFGAGTTSLLHGWDWTALETQHANPLVVDVGGANGYASVLLARRHPNLRFEVQDLPEVIEKTRDDIPLDLRRQITMKPHDFRDPQQTQADVYLLRRVLHNWSDDDCIAVLRALTPALKPGARVVLNDYIVTPPGQGPLLTERVITHTDLVMMSLFGAREREKRDWQRLFTRADSRFTDFKAQTHECCCLGIVEVTWSG